MNIWQDENYRTTNYHAISCEKKSVVDNIYNYVYSSIRMRESILVTPSAHQRHYWSPPQKKQNIKEKKWEKINEIQFLLAQPKDYFISVMLIAQQKEPSNILRYFRRRRCSTYIYFSTSTIYVNFGLIKIHNFILESSRPPIAFDGTHTGPTCKRLVSMCLCVNDENIVYTRTVCARRVCYGCLDHIGPMWKIFGCETTHRINS